MVDVPAGKRLWKCPDCGREVLLSVTQLDPLACDECLAKLKGHRTPASASTPLPLPDLPILLAIGAALLVIGLIVGFVAGRMSVPPPPFVRPTRPADDTAKPAERPSTDVNVEDDGPDEATRPGANYKWVRGYTRKDGVKVKGHWSKK
jgi:DNA-directed RNA polymerase subunit RPC12/RpoP